MDILEKKVSSIKSDLTITANHNYISSDYSIDGLNELYQELKSKDNELFQYLVPGTLILMGILSIVYFIFHPGIFGILGCILSLISWIVVRVIIKIKVENIKVLKNSLSNMRKESKEYYKNFKIYVKKGIQFKLFKNYSLLFCIILFFPFIMIFSLGIINYSIGFFNYFVALILSVAFGIIILEPDIRKLAEIKNKLSQI